MVPPTRVHALFAIPVALAQVAAASGCGASATEEPAVAPVDAPQASPAPTPVEAAAAAQTADATASTAPASPPKDPEADLPKARDPRGVTKRADGKCFEFAPFRCPAGQTCKPPQPHRVRCPE